MTDTPRVSIHAGDPPEVFEIEAKLLTEYSERIARDVDDILGKCPDPKEAQAEAAAYIAKIGENIQDDTIKAAVKRLATVKFRLRGIT